MQSAVNIIVIQGGVVRDVELLYTAEGLAYTQFTIANCSLAYKNGEKTEEVSYFDVSAWAKLAEICAAYLKRGSRVIISGKLKQSRWTSREGKRKSKIRIVAQDVKFLPYQKKVSS